MIRAALAALTLMTAPAFADFTENNLLAIFYHELGHAVIDQMQAPNFGQAKHHDVRRITELAGRHFQAIK